MLRKFVVGVIVCDFRLDSLILIKSSLFKILFDNFLFWYVVRNLFILRIDWKDLNVVWI